MADLVEPAYLSVPDEYDERRTLGPEVAAVATLAGFPPDPEQQLLLDVSFALDKRGAPLIFDSTVIAPRQNLKTGFLKQRALGKLFITDRRLVVWSAHEFTTAQEAARDVEELISGSDLLRRRVKMTARNEVAKHGTLPQIELLSGARLIFKTRTSGGGRGLAGDDLFVDESYAAQSGQIGAVMPIMLARPGSQVDFASSACRPESAYLWSLVEQGRKGAGPRSLYAEWCTPPAEVACDLGADCDHARGRQGCGCDKPEVIILAHSAVTRGRIDMQKIVDLRAKMPPAEFAREIMGWHDETIPDSSVPVVDREKWAAALDAACRMIRPSVFAVEIALDRSSSAIAAAGPALVSLTRGRRAVRTAVELVEYERGTAGLLDRCIALNETHRPVTFIVDGGGPAKSLIEPMQEAGIEVLVLDTADVAMAYAGLVDALNDGTIAHGPDEVLQAAVEGAKRRNIGERGFAAARRTPDVDVAPLNAVAFAHFGRDAAVGFFVY